MANLHLVTGYAGTAHITAADHGSFNSALFGTGDYVLYRGNRFAASVISNNQIRVLDGDIIMQGRHVRLEEDTYVDLAIDNGAQGYYRNDLIVARYTINASSAIEEVNLVVIKGTAVTSNPADPAYTQGDIITDHAAQYDMPLWRVKIENMNLTATEKLFTEFDMNIPGLLAKFGEKMDNINSLDHAAAIAAADLIAYYQASTQAQKNIKFSELAEALKTYLAAKTHNHSANDITSGTLPVARGGTGVTSLAALATALGGVKIAHGSYVGTNKCGQNNLNSLTFEFEPKLVVVRIDSVQYDYGAIFIRGISCYNVDAHRDSTMFGNVADWGANSLSWYANSINEQLNNSNIRYHYVAIG